MFLLHPKTLLNPSTQIPSLLRFFSIHNSTNPKKPTIPDEPSSTSYDELIHKAGDSKDLTTLHRLLNKRYKDGFFNTSNTFNFLTDSNIDTHLNDLINTLSTLNKGFARRNAFDCLISRLCKLNHINESLQIINTMVDKQIGVNPITFHPILYTLSRKRKVEEALGIIAKMKDLGLSIDITSYNYILSSFCFSGDLIGAAGVLEEIQKQGLKPNPNTYDDLVMGACKVGKVEGALVLVRRMEEDGVPPLYSTHLHVIRGLLGLGCCKQAIEFVMAFAGRYKGLDTETFGYLGFNLIRKKVVEEAKLVLGEMDKRGLVMGDKLRSQYKELLADSN